MGVAEVSRDPAWRAGWWRQARVAASPNFEARPADVDISLVVLHAISLPPAVFTGACVEDFFLNRLDHHAHPYFETLAGVRVSAHFFIRRTGEVIQFVSVFDRAWHAGASAWRGREKCNDYSVGIELEGCEPQPFTSCQYTSLWPLLDDLCRLLPVTAVAGHEHIAPGRKQDPGPGFDWTALAMRYPDKMMPA
jgi:AmpD protein